MNKRRFIAGAVCPRCAAMDKIIVDLETDARECVSCGFTEARPKGPAAAAEVPPRVSRDAARRVETAAEAIRFMEPVEINPDKSG